MTPMHTGSEELIKDVVGLIEQERDAKAACNAALDHLEGRDRVAIEGFARSHQRHEHELIDALGGLGGAPRDSGESLLSKGKVVLGALAGEQSTLVAIKTSEDKLLDAYQAISAEPMPPRTHDTIARCHDDLRCHRSWLDDRLHVVGVVGEKVMDPSRDSAPGQRVSHA